MTDISRRTAIRHLAAAAAAVSILPGRAHALGGIPIAVYKDASCGCCHKWVEHLTASGFAPTVTDTPAMPAIKTKYKVTERLQSCHTALAGGYVIEGHVPAGDIKKLLATKPKGILGLTIPGMPQSAPGMDMTPFQAFTVLSFDDKGNTAVFAKHATA